MNTNPRTMIIPEMLQHVNSAPTPAQRVSALRQYGSATMRAVLKNAMDRTCNFVKMEIPSWQRRENEPVHMSPSNLHHAVKSIPVLYAGSGVPIEKARALLIQILESVHPTEADVFISMLRKTLHIDYPNLIPSVVATAFPGLVLVPIDATPGAINLSAMSVVTDSVTSEVTPTANVPVSTPKAAKRKPGRPKGSGKKQKAAAAQPVVQPQPAQPPRAPAIDPVASIIGVWNPPTPGTGV